MPNAALRASLSSAEYIVHERAAAMSGAEDPEMSKLFDEANGGCVEARAAFLQRVYETLKLMAHRELRKHEQSLQATELVHEAWMRLFGSESKTWNDRKHFMRFAAKAMRSIIIDRVRKRRAAKRGGDFVRIPLDEVIDRMELSSGGIDDFESALERLRNFDPELAEVVDLRFYAEQAWKDIAALLSVSERTAHRRWQAALLWLKKEIHGT